MVEISRLFWKKAYTSDAILLGEVESAELRHEYMANKKFLHRFN